MIRPSFVVCSAIASIFSEKYFLLSRPTRKKHGSRAFVVSVLFAEKPGEIVFFQLNRNENVGGCGSRKQEMACRHLGCYLESDEKA